MGNYSHFNEYKHLYKHVSAGLEHIDDPQLFVRDMRQARVDSLPPPRSEVDIGERLSDGVVFSPTGTLVTLVLNGTTGRLNVWCCGVSASSAFRKPMYTWNLFGFFNGTQ